MTDYDVIKNKIKTADTESLLKALYSFDDSERDYVASELKRRQDVRAIKPLVELYVDPARQQTPDSDGDVSSVIPWAIVSFGSQAIPELVKHLDFGPIFWVIGAIKHPSATPYLVNILQNAPSNHIIPILRALYNCADLSAIEALKLFKQKQNLSRMIREEINDAIEKINERYIL